MCFKSLKGVFHFRTHFNNKYRFFVFSFSYFAAIQEISPRNQCVLYCNFRRNVNKLSFVYSPPRIRNSRTLSYVSFSSIIYYNLSFVIRLLMFTPIQGVDFFLDLVNLDIDIQCWPFKTWESMLDPSIEVIPT